VYAYCAQNAIWVIGDVMATYPGRPWNRHVDVPQLVFDKSPHLIVMRADTKLFSRIGFKLGPQRTAAELFSRRQMPHFAICPP
jgi:hypothetical protein